MSQAAEEAIEAAAWYDKERPGLGQDFLNAIDAAFDLIEAETVPLSPMPGRLATSNLKKLTLRRFPYNIIVIEKPDVAIVVAIAHQSRKPAYWKTRFLS